MSGSIRRFSVGWIFPFAFAQSLGMLVATVAHAANFDSPEVREQLAAAEATYEQVDFAATYQASCQALERGRANVSQTLRLHVLCGISSAALSKSDEARSHFEVVLAIRPELHLERELSPKIRSPYLEAQGYWSRFEERLAIKVLSRDSASPLRLTLVDPAHLSGKVRVYVRPVGAPGFRSADFDSAGAITVQLGHDEIRRGYDYYAVAIDAHGNALFELGNEGAPNEVRPPQAHFVATPAESKGAPEVQDSQTHERSSSWLPLTLTLTGVAVTGTGVIFNVIRENAAHKWNGSSCEQPGQSRIQQCGDVNSERANAEHAAVAFYATGGILLTTGITMLLLPHRAVAAPNQGRPSAKSADCTIAFPMAAVFCSARF